jgi:hypothetical protein
MALGILFVAIVPWINWSRLYNLAGEGNHPEVVASTAVVAGVFLLSIPLGVVERVRLGYQEGFINAVFAALGGLLGLGSVLLVIHFRGGLLVVAGAGSATTPRGGLNGVLLFAHQRPWFRPGGRQWTGKPQGFITARKPFPRPALPWLAFTSDNLIVALLDLPAVTDFPSRPGCWSDPDAVGLVLTPLARLRKATKATAIGSDDASSLDGRDPLVAAALAAVLVCWGPAIVRVWVGPEVRVPFSCWRGWESGW